MIAVWTKFTNPEMERFVRNLLMGITPTIHPVRVFFINTLFLFLTMACHCWGFLQSPWFGFEHVYDESTQVLKVTNTVPYSPADGVLLPGDEINWISNIEGDRIQVSSAIFENLYFKKTFAEVNSYFDYHDRLFEVISSNQVYFHLASGEVRELTPLEKRPIFSIPSHIMLAAIIIVFIEFVGVGIWSFNQQKAEARLLAMCAMSIVGLLLTVMGQDTKELTIDPLLYRLGAWNNLFFFFFFGFSLCAMFWYYPRRLGNPLVGYGILTVGFYLWLNEVFQVVELSSGIGSYYFKYFIPYILGLVLLIFQWFASRDNPVDRAKLLSFLLFVESAHILGGVYFLSPNNYFLLHHSNNMIVVLLPFYLIVFIGLVIGCSNYRLASIERWWIFSWFWYLAAFIVFVLDYLLIKLFSNSQQEIHLLSLLAAACLYVPLKNVIWKNFLNSETLTPKDYISKCLEAFYPSEAKVDVSQTFFNLLRDCFNPVAIHWTDEAVAQNAYISNNGYSLNIPFPEENRTLRLEGKFSGRKLFHPSDEKSVNELKRLALRAALVAEAREKAAANERIRIMRDLHDDVGAELLTLVHQASAPQDKESARSALKSLRESIYTLDVREGRIPLESVLLDCLVEMRNRLRESGMELDSDFCELPLDLEVSARQKINIDRILKEVCLLLANNGIKGNVVLKTHYRNACFNLEILIPKGMANAKLWYGGDSVHKILTRAREINSQITWFGKKSSGAKKLLFSLEVENMHS